MVCSPEGLIPPLLWISNILQCRNYSTDSLGCGSEVKHLPGMCKMLGPVPSIIRTNLSSKRTFCFEKIGSRGQEMTQSLKYTANIKT